MLRANDDDRDDDEKSIDADEEFAHTNGTSSKTDD